MFRPTSRLIARSTAARVLPRASPVAPARRFISTAPPAQKSRSWKSLAARWGAAGAIVYYYSTSNLFAEEPAQAITAPHYPEADAETEQLPTLEVLAAERQRRKESEAAMVEQKAAQGTPPEGQDIAVSGEKGDMEGLEEDADQQGAFNPETGEINWDCPCLGGMADGPCGEDFKAAFSCFVFSTEEPKGMDCIDKFKNMQNCFRAHPDVYGSELQDDEEDDVSAADLEDPGLASAENTSAKSATSPEHSPSSNTSSNSATSPDSTPSSDTSSRNITPSEKSSPPTPPPSNPQAEKVSQPRNSEEDQQAMTKRADAATKQVKNDHEPLSESERVIPRAQFDARE